MKVKRIKKEKQPMAERSFKFIITGEEMMLLNAILGQATINDEKNAWLNSTCVSGDYPGRNCGLNMFTVMCTALKK